MPQIIQPQVPDRKAQDQKSLFKIAGAVVGGVVGGYFGNAPGAIAGAGAGASLGDQAGSMLVKDDTNKVTPSIQPGQQSQALARRQQQLETDNLTQLRDAEQAAAQLPEEQRQRVLPTLTRARLMEQQQRGVRNA